MFKIAKLTLYGEDNKQYDYLFHEGINFFVGANSTGKTEFYKFIDYMFGSSSDIVSNEWNNGTLLKASMEIEYDGRKYRLTRTTHTEENYFMEYGDTESEGISLEEYKDRLSDVFSHNEDALREMRDFTEENLSYRTFTMFNFLGEQGQGITRDFLDKCRDIKYSVKLNPILNYIFNDNLKEIEKIKKQIDTLKEKIKEYELQQERYSSNCNQINNNLLKLNIDTIYNGHNADEIRRLVDEKACRIDYSVEKVKNTMGELEVIYSNLSEQIKVYETTVSNYKQMAKENENRRKLLINLQTLVEEDSSLEYLVNPLNNLLKEVENCISFSKYVISDGTIGELRKQRERIKTEMTLQDSKYKCYSLETKTKAATLIRAYLDMDIKDILGELTDCKRNLDDLRKKLLKLQSEDNSSKIQAFTRDINDIYKSGETQSSFVRCDVEKGIKIEYSKRGNILQTVKPDRLSLDDTQKANLGSMARHTLIQLCGYTAFMKLFIEDPKYPIIPLLVIDHISKPFSDENSKAIGSILNCFLEHVGKKNAQIILFDDRRPEDLGITNVVEQKLVVGDKSGFNPFYTGRV